MNKLLESIKKNEGFVGNAYKDSLGKPTIGYGTLLPLDEVECLMLLEYRLNKSIKLIRRKQPIILKLSEQRQNVIYEMAYQMGVNNVLKFKKMFSAIKENDFKKASFEMLNSKWHIQTPKRAESLAKIMLENG